MKNLVKPFGEFANEARYHLSGDSADENPDHEEIRSLGFDERIELADRDAVARAIDDHFAGNVELMIKWHQFEEVLAKVTSDFAKKYKYDIEDLQDSASSHAEYGAEGGYPMDVAVAQEIQKRLV